VTPGELFAQSKIGNSSVNRFTGERLTNISNERF